MMGSRAIGSSWPWPRRTQSICSWCWASALWSVTSKQVNNLFHMFGLEAGIPPLLTYPGPLQPPDWWRSWPLWTWQWLDSGTSLSWPYSASEISWLPWERLTGDTLHNSPAAPGSWKTRGFVSCEPPFHPLGVSLVSCPWCPFLVFWLQEDKTYKVQKREGSVWLLNFYTQRHVQSQTQTHTTQTYTPSPPPQPQTAKKEAPREIPFLLMDNQLHKLRTLNKAQGLTALEYIGQKALALTAYFLLQSQPWRISSAAVSSEVGSLWSKERPSPLK